MKYKLAKELINAGFVTKKTFFPYDDYVCPHENDGPSYRNHVAHCSEHKYFPTLSELIEACGQGFGGLGRTEDCEYGIHWTSGKGKNKRTGSTPEEAVARLWLALHGKKTT